MNSQSKSDISNKIPKEDDREVLVRVDNVSKKFCRDLKKSLWYGVKDVASELLPFSSNKAPRTTNLEPSSSLRPGEFWANKDISFELRRGQCLGLIGHNGAGKTTLLKMLNGLIKPDSGTIEMRGRVGALIALGAGFNPILTGRENIYVNGSILGLSKKEIEDKIDEIIDFAEIPDFIDSPVQSYSSGMQVRLGFAVATALDPDVLILDEVLAVGDIVFREKCLIRISEMLSKAAVIFVSHNMAQVSRICDLGLYLKKGRSVAFRDVETALHNYQRDMKQKRGGNMAIKALGSGVVGLDVKIAGKSEICLGDDLNLELLVTASTDLKVDEVMISIEDGKEATAAQSFLPIRGGITAGESLFRVSVRNLRLKGDTYFVSVVLFGRKRQLTFARVRCGAEFSSPSEIGVFCPYNPSSDLILEDRGIA